MEGEAGAVVDPEVQRAFFGLVRESVISLLLFSLFYVISYWIVSYFKQQIKDGSYRIVEQDAVVYRIISWLCSIALTVSIGAMVLLPFSILSNEIRHLYPDTYYVKWLNTSLIMGLWNKVFLGSNLCLFLLLPFAYFFTESEGLPGKKGVMSRVYETVIVLVLLAVLVLGMLWVADALMSRDNDTPHIVDFQNLLSYVPVLYSCIAMLGVLLTSVCTPVGFSHLFVVLGKVIVQPKLHTDVDQELESLKMEESAIQRRRNVSLNSVNLLAEERRAQTMGELQQKRNELERHQRSSAWERHLLYPFFFLLLLSLTCVSLLLVSFNIFSLILGVKHAPVGAQAHLHSLGEESSSYLGPLGAVVEITLIIYMMAASLVGFYCSPVLQRFAPVPHNTSMMMIILNSIVLIVLSSAMPVMVRALGITNYNLLGHFSSMSILNHFWLVLSYNILFFVLTCLILFKKATHSVLIEVTYLLRVKLKRLKVPYIARRSKKHTE